MAETEAVLLRRFVRSGDAEAFAEIIRRYAGLVYSAALRVLADVDRASDVAQETFLQLAKDGGTVTGSLPGWLHRVATHKAIDQVRRDATRRHRESEYMAARPHEAADWREISPYVDEGLNLLDPQLRNILILHFLEGRSTREIARTQGLSQATISRRIEAGVEQLRAGLRRRGILVAAGALGILLGENAVQAAPPVLLTELGKIALISGSLSASTGAAGASVGLNALATSTLAAVKANVVAVAVAAAVIIGAGSVFTYRQVTETSKRPAEAPVEPAGSAAGGIASDPRLGPPAGSAPADVQSQGAGEVTARTVADAARFGGASQYVSSNPARQGLPGPEAETDPRTYVPDAASTGAPGSGGAILAASSPLGGDMPDPQSPVAGTGPRLPRPTSGAEDPNYRVIPQTQESPYEMVMRLRREAAANDLRASGGVGSQTAVLAGSVVARADLRLAPPFIGNPGGVLGLERQDTTTVRPSGMLETPPDAPREPVYFVVRAGGREIQGITYRSIRSTGEIVLLLDTDGDGLWSDERPYVGTRLRIFSRTATYEFGPVSLKQGTVEPGGAAVYAQCSDGKWLNFWPAFYRAGEVVLDGRTYKISLVDSDFDGRFNESSVLPVADSPNPDCDVLAIDLNGDLRFSPGRMGGSEILPLGKLVNIGGQYYSIEVPEDGSTIEFRRAEPALGQSGLGGEQVAPALRPDASPREPNGGMDRP